MLKGIHICDQWILTSPIPRLFTYIEDVEDQQPATRNAKVPAKLKLGARDFTDCWHRKSKYHIHHVKFTLIMLRVASKLAPTARTFLKSVFDAYGRWEKCVRGRYKRPQWAEHSFQRFIFSENFSIVSRCAACDYKHVTKSPSFPYPTVIPVEVVVVPESLRVVFRVFPHQRRYEAIPKCTVASWRMRCERRSDGHKYCELRDSKNGKVDTAKKRSTTILVWICLITSGGDRIGQCLIEQWSHMLRL